MSLIGPTGTSPGPSARTPEDAAAEFFFNRAFAGKYAPRPPVERWRPDQRQRFEAELARREREAELERLERSGGAVGETGSS